MKKQLTLAVCLIALSGCSSYRTNSDMGFDSTDTLPAHTANLLPIGIDVTGKKYDELGTVKASIKKLTAFHKNPTQEQANIILSHEAKKLDADAVIDVTYDSGIALDSWGRMKAEGTAIKFTK